MAFKLRCFVADNFSDLGTMMKIKCFKNTYAFTGLRLQSCACSKENVLGA